MVIEWMILRTIATGHATNIEKVKSLRVPHHRNCDTFYQIKKSNGYFPMKYAPEFIQHLFGYCGSNDT